MKSIDETRWLQKQEAEPALGAAGVDANCTTWPVDLNLKQLSVSAADLFSSRSHSPDVVNAAGRHTTEQVFWVAAGRINDFYVL